MLRKLSANSAGAALVDYGLLVALIALVAIGGVSSLGSQISNSFGGIADDLSGAVASSGAGSETGAEAGDGTVVASIAFTAGTRSPDTGFFDGSRFSNPDGTLLSFSSSRFSDTDAIYISADTQINVYLTGTYGADTEGMRLVCDHQPDVKLPLHVWSLNNFLGFQDGVSRPGFFISGDSYSCDILDAT